MNESNFSGLFTDPAESSDIANSVEDTDGVYFVPAFSGLGVSIKANRIRILNLFVHRLRLMIIKPLLV